MIKKLTIKKINLIGVDVAKEPDKIVETKVKITPKKTVEVLESRVIAKKPALSTKPYWKDTPKFLDYKNPEQYKKAGVLPIEPMTAKEETREDELEKMLQSNSGYYVEEKFDGTRATLHFMADHCRLFSRRISKKTNWYTENSDSVPQLRDMYLPSLDGTIIDGEMLIPDRDFKDASSTMNCNWDKAIERQKELGNLVLNAFDIIYYNHENVTNLPLWKRKELLHEVIEEVQKSYPNAIKEVRYSDSTLDVYMDSNTDSVMQLKNNHNQFRANYPELLKCVGKYNILDLPRGVTVPLTKKAYYEFIVANGGEGIILKDRLGKYYHKRGREYTKMKKFITRDCVVIGFTVPTKLYDGKTLAEGGTWDYWGKDNPEAVNICPEYSGVEIKIATMNLEKATKLGYYAITKHYALHWVGNIQFGVVVTQEEKQMLCATKKGKDFEFWRVGDLDLVLVGDCAGYDEEQREEFTINARNYKGQTVEILANEIFGDTGKLRHPRFLRMRPDKAPEKCIWLDHIGG